VVMEMARSDGIFFAALFGICYLLVTKCPPLDVRNPKLRVVKSSVSVLPKSKSVS